MLLVDFNIINRFYEIDEIKACYCKENMVSHIHNVCVGARRKDYYLRQLNHFNTCRTITEQEKELTLSNESYLPLNDALGTTVGNVLGQLAFLVLLVLS